MLGVFIQAQSILSPGALMEAALKEYERSEKEVEDQRGELSMLLKRLSELDVQVSGGRLRLTLTRPQALRLVGDYLSKIYLPDGGASSELREAPSGSGFDGVMILPNFSVYVTLEEEVPSTESIDAKVRKAMSLNPGQVWAFCIPEVQRHDSRFDPVFVSENKVLRGRLRVLPVSDVFKEISGGRLRASATPTTAKGERSVTFVFERFQPSR